MTNFLYILGIGSGHNDAEIYHSIRTLCKYYKNKSYRIYISGSKPRQDCGDITLHQERDIFSNNREGNILHKTLSFLKAHPEVKSFVAMNDDYIFNTPFDASLFEPKHKGQLDRYVHGTLNPYMKSLIKTRDWLSKNNYPTLNYDVHFPVKYSSESFIKCFDKIDWKFNSEGYVVRSIYQNITDPKPNNFVNDCKTNKIEVARSLPFFSMGDDFPVWQLNEF